ncbi:hypothetical protein T439DRAFT_343590 [Meredithblackwellia eburnea MCA 4105]
MSEDDAGHSRGGRGQRADSGRGSTGGRGGRGRGHSNAAQGAPGSIPSGSISKLKAQLRQTKRLLARDDLTPDVRITSERRLKTLNLELEKASTGALEQKMVTRYRGVKFFERQKLLRKIKQAKKALVALPGDKDLLQTLLEARIDLHYVLRYPKTEKYISLFPEGTYVPHSSTSSSFTSNPLSTSKSKAKDPLAVRNAQVGTKRADVKRRMDSGELSLEPETGNLGIEGEEDVAPGNVDEETAEVVQGGNKRTSEEEERPPSKKARTDGKELVDVESDTKETEEKSAKKLKKDAKDAKRREKKRLAALAGEQGGESDPKKLAFDDDFFE